MSFAEPGILWLLPVLLPLLGLFYWWAFRKRRELMQKFIKARLLPSLTVGISPRRQKISIGLLLLAVAFLIIALARPLLGFRWEEVKMRGLDIVVAIDTSKSMLAEDVAPDRLSRAKLAALDLMNRARSDRLGLVAFAGAAFLQCPLTFDEAAFRQSLEVLDVNTIPQGGTALAEAIQSALTAYKEGDNYKVLVIFTDGEDQDSGALDAAKKAAQAGLQIFTVGVGTPAGEVLRLRDGKGRTDYVRDAQGNVVKSHLNEALLRDIASATRGQYILLQGSRTMDILYDQALARIPKTESGERRVRQYNEHYHWPLGIAILLLAIEMVLPERGRRNAAVSANAAAGRTLKPAAAIILFLFATGTLWASPSSALREYNAGHYESAYKEYQRLMQKDSQDSRLHYNAGASAYRNRQYEEAAKQFGESLTTPDLKLQQQAYYNLGNSLFHLGEAVTQPEKQTQSWQQALTHYESALKLNPNDTDAKYNYDYVKKRLEQLQQQQQKQQQNKDNKDQDKKDNQDQQQSNQQQQQQQDQKDKQSKDQQNAQQQQQDQQKSEQAKNNPENNKDQQKSEPKPDQNEQASQKQESTAQKDKDKDKEQEKEQQQAQQNQDEKAEENAQEEQKQYAAGQMTPQQARQMLDAQKGREMIMPQKPRKPASERPTLLRDW